MTQAQQLQKVERTVPVGDFFLGNVQGAPGFAQALGGIGLRHPGGQGHDARGVDEGRGAVELEIQGVRVGSVVGQDEIAHHPQRRTVAQCVAGHLPQEARILLHGPAEPGAQVERQRGIAGERAKVEKDAAVQQCFGIALIDPAGEHTLPGLVGQTPFWIARHDAALAQRKAAGVQAFVDAPGEGQQRFDFGIAGLVENQRVVLVGRQGLLHPSFRAQSQPAPAHIRQVQRTAFQIDHAFGETVVEAGNDRGEVFRVHPLRQQAVRQFADVARQDRQLLDRLGACHGARDAFHAQAPQGEHVLFGDHADQRSLRDQRQVMDALLRHQ